MSEEMKTQKLKVNPESWVDQYGDRLYHYALLRLQNPEAAKNAVQETFLSALKSFSRFSGKSSEYTWLVGILKNKIVDTIRKAQRERMVFEAQEEDSSLDLLFNKIGKWMDPPTDWMDPSKLAENGEFWEIFRYCLSNLPEHLALTFSLKELETIPYKEICKLLDITTTNLWVLLHRARLKLKTCLEANWLQLKESSK